jgi:hypothetical protein
MGKLTGENHYVYKSQFSSYVGRKVIQISILSEEHHFSGAIMIIIWLEYMSLKLVLLVYIGSVLPSNIMEEHNEEHNG